MSEHSDDAEIKSWQVEEYENRQNELEAKKMKVEIKSVTQNDSNYKGNVTKRKAVETSEGTYNISEKIESYASVPIGFVGKAEITLGEYKDKKYIDYFKAGEGKVTQTPQKADTGQPAQDNGKYRSCPDKLAQEKWRRRHCSWIGCLQCTINYEKGLDNELSVANVVGTTNKFYDALCLKVDGKSSGQPPNNINNDIHSKGGHKVNVNQPEANAMADATKKYDTNEDENSGTTYGEHYEDMKRD